MRGNLSQIIITKITLIFMIYKQNDIDGEIIKCFGK